ncbi:MAG: hypothetical protein ACSNEK_00875 [Parachlamydiaceae bacterium]
MKISDFFYHLCHPFTLRTGQSLANHERKISKIALLLTPIGFYIVSYCFKRKLNIRTLAESYTMAHVRAQIASRNHSDYLCSESASEEGSHKVEETMLSEEVLEHQRCDEDAPFFELAWQEGFLAQRKLESLLKCDGPFRGVELKGLLDHHETLFFEFFRKVLLDKRNRLVEECLEQMTLPRLAIFTERPDNFSAVAGYVYPSLNMKDLDLSESHFLLFKRSLYMLLGKLPYWINSRDLDGFASLILKLEKRKIQAADRLRALCVKGMLDNEGVDAETIFELLSRHGWQEILKTREGHDAFLGKLFRAAKGQALSFFEKKKLFFSTFSNVDLLKEQAESADLDWSGCLKYIKFFYREQLLKAMLVALDSHHQLEAFVPVLDQTLILELFAKKHDGILFINGVQFPINEKFLKAFAKWETLFSGGKSASQSSLPFDESSLKIIVSFLAVRTNHYLSGHQREWGIKDFKKSLTYDKLSFFRHSDLFPVAYSLNLVYLLPSLIEQNKINASSWFFRKFRANKAIYDEYLSSKDSNLVLDYFQELEDAFVQEHEFPKKAFYRFMILTDRYKYYQAMLTLSKTHISVFPTMYQCLSPDNCDEFFKLYNDCCLTFQDETVPTNQIFLASLFPYFEFTLKLSYSHLQVGQVDCAQLPVSWNVLKEIHDFARTNELPKITDANIDVLLKAVRSLNPDGRFEYLHAEDWLARLNKRCEEWLLANRQRYTFYQYLAMVRQDGGNGFQRAADLLDEEVVDQFGTRTLCLFAKNGSFFYGIHDQVDELFRGNLGKRQLIKLYFQLREQASSKNKKEFLYFLIASELERCKPILEGCLKSNHPSDALRIMRKMNRKDALELMLSGHHTLSFRDMSLSVFIPLEQLKKIFPSYTGDSIGDDLNRFEQATFLQLIEIYLFTSLERLEDSNVFNIYDLAKILGISRVKADAATFIGSRLDEMIRYQDSKIFFYRKKLIARPGLLADRLKEIDNLAVQGKFRFWQDHIPFSTTLNVDGCLLDRKSLKRFNSLTININSNQAFLLQRIASYAPQKELSFEIVHGEGAKKLKECLKAIPKDWNIASIRLICQQGPLGQVDRAVLVQLKKFSSLKQVVFVSTLIDPHLALSFENISSLTFECTEVSRIQLLNLSPSIKSLHFVETFLNDEGVKELCEKLSLEEITLTLHRGLQARHVRRLKKEFPHIKFNCE